VVIGRDARLSGQMVSDLVCATLQALDSTSSTWLIDNTHGTKLRVPLEKAGGGIILTASHNPIHWNALKLLNEKGEFISAADGCPAPAHGGRRKF